MQVCGTYGRCADCPSEDAKFSLKHLLRRIECSVVNGARRSADARRRRAQERSLRYLRAMDPHILHDIGFSAEDLAYWERTGEVPAKERPQSEKKLTFPRVP